MNNNFGIFLRGFDVIFIIGRSSFGVYVVIVCPTAQPFQHESIYFSIWNYLNISWICLRKRLLTMTVSFYLAYHWTILFCYERKINWRSILVRRHVSIFSNGIQGLDTVSHCFNSTVLIFSSKISKVFAIAISVIRF